MDETRRVLERNTTPRHDVRALVDGAAGAAAAWVDLPATETLAEFKHDVAPLPKKGVGLLFMAYNVSLARQFVFMQASWANNAGFQAPNTGIDPITGQGVVAGPGPQWSKAWDDPASVKQNFDFHGFVTMRGGEYFCAPSLTFFKTL